MDNCPICGMRPTPMTSGNGFVRVECVRRGLIDLAGDAFDGPRAWREGTTIRVVDRSAPVKSIHSSRGKRARAEPVAAIYE